MLVKQVVGLPAPLVVLLERIPHRAEVAALIAQVTAVTVALVYSS
jgi:hypothetical protein